MSTPNASAPEPTCAEPAPDLILRITGQAMTIGTATRHDGSQQDRS